MLSGVLVRLLEAKAGLWSVFIGLVGWRSKATAFNEVGVDELGHGEVELGECCLQVARAIRRASRDIGHAIPIQDQGEQGLATVVEAGQSGCVLRQAECNGDVGVHGE